MFIELSHLSILIDFPHMQMFGKDQFSKNVIKTVSNLYFLFLTLNAPNATRSRLLFSSAEMFKKFLWLLYLIRQ